jgi:hypothetical protein
MSTQREPAHDCLRCRREDGSAVTVNLTELQEALEGTDFLEYYFLPETGRTVSILKDQDLDDLEEDEESPIPEDAESLPVDPIDSRTKFEWMEEFTESVQSVTAKFQLTEALRRQKPFRNFKDALAQLPKLQDLWFAFEAQKTKVAAIAFLEELDWEVLNVMADPELDFSEPQDPSIHAPITEEELTWILRGAWQVAGRGGRTQLALLLKGSQNKDLLKHHLDKAPAYGKLSLLTIPEIQDRIDQAIRKGDIGVVRSGDLPLIALTDEGWSVVQPWAHAEEIRRAAADKATLQRVIYDWRNRPRKEQVQLLGVFQTFSRDQVAAILEAWQIVAGKEIRAQIQRILQQSSSAEREI